VVQINAFRAARALLARLVKVTRLEMTQRVLIRCAMLVYHRRRHLLRHRHLLLQERIALQTIMSSVTHASRALRVRAEMLVIPPRVVTRRVSPSLARRMSML
jgi:hypothetical protein